jgi:cyanophycinase
MSGTLALVGGGEWQEGCTFDTALLKASGGTSVTVLPTAAAYEHPERAVEQATQWFAERGADVRGLMVLRRPDAEDAANARAVRESRFLYLSGGSPMHLRSVLKDSEVWTALVETWRDGAVLAGSSAGAMALCDPMVDPRGGAFTVGLGLVEQLAFIPHHDTCRPTRPSARSSWHRPGCRSSRWTSAPRSSATRTARGPWREWAARSCSSTAGRRASRLSRADGSALGDRHRLDRDRLLRLARAGCADRVDGGHDVEPADDLPEQRVLRR